MNFNKKLAQKVLFGGFVFYWSANLKSFKFISGRFMLPADRIQLGLHDMAITTYFLFFCQKS